MLLLHHWDKQRHRKKKKKRNRRRRRKKEKETREGESDTSDKSGKVRGHLNRPLSQDTGKGVSSAVTESGSLGVTTNAQFTLQSSIRQLYIFLHLALVKADKIFNM